MSVSVVARPVALPVHFADRRRSTRAALALTSAAAALLASLSATGAQAQACGPVAADGSLVCTPDGNPHAGGIAYTTPPAAPGDPVVDLGLVLEEGVRVRIPQNAGPLAGIALTGTGAAGVTLTSRGDARVRTLGDDQTGVRITTEGGAIRVVAPEIVTFGDRSQGLSAITSGGGAIDVLAGDVETQGNQSRALNARANAGGDITLVSTGTVRTAGDVSSGMVANTTAGTVSIGANRIVTEGNGSDALVAVGSDVHVEVSGALRTRGAQSYGIYARANDGDALVQLDGEVRTQGFASRGVDVDAAGSAQVIGGGSISTRGDLATAVSVRADDGDAVVDLAYVSTRGQGSNGATASTLHGDARVTVIDGETRGEAVRTLDAFSTYGDATVVSTGTIVARGERGIAVSASATGGEASITVNDVIATGARGRAIDAEGSTVRVVVNGTAATQQSDIAYGATVSALGFADYDTGVGGDVFVTNNGRIVSRGDNVAALIASGDGSVTIDGAGAFETHGNDSNGLRLTSGGALSADIGSVRTRGDYATGIVAESGAGATVHVDRVRTSGVASNGVEVSAAGNIDFAARRVVTRGYGSTGVVLSGTAEGSAIDARLGSIDTFGDNAIGLELKGAAGGSVSIDVDSIETRGDNSAGIKVNLDSGGMQQVSIRAGTLAAGGQISDGIFLTGEDEGSATIALGSATIVGNQSAGVYADARDFLLDVTANTLDVTGERTAGLFLRGREVTAHTTGTVTQAGDNGAGLYLQGTRSVDVTVDDALSATGENVLGLVVQAYEDLDTSVTVNATGPIHASGYFATGVSLDSSGTIDAHLGDVSVDTGGAEFPLVGFAALMVANGDVNASIGNVSSDGFAFQAVYARSRGGNVTLDVNGKITTTATAALAVEALNGTATVEMGDMQVYGYDNAAVIITADAADVRFNGDIDDHMIIANDSFLPGPVVLVSTIHDSHIVQQGRIDAHTNLREGIMLHAGGNVDLSGAGTTHTRGSFSRAVRLEILGDARLAQTAARTEGDFSAGMSGSVGGDLAVDFGTLATRGLLSDGLDVTVGGSATIDVDTIRTEGGLSRGMAVSAGQDIAVRVGSVTTLGGRSTGLNLSAPGDVTVTAGSVMTAGNNAAGMSLSGTDVAVEVDSIATGGRAAFGIVANANGTLTVDAGSISTRGLLSHGLFADAQNAIARADRIATTGDNAWGINLVSHGEADVRLGMVATDGANADGIGIDAEGPLRIAVDQVDVTGAGARGLVARGGGDVTVTVGQVNAFEADGIVIAAGGTAVLDVTGGVSAAGDAVAFDTGGGARLVNSGVIFGSSGAAVRATGGAATIDNRGAILGRLVLDDGADNVANSGLLVLTAGTDLGGGDDRLVNDGVVELAGDIAFGGGNDSFVNRGVLRFGDAPAPATLRALAFGPQSRTITGIEHFDNSALVDLANGIPGDLLTLSGSFAGSGGSTLALDVRYGAAPLADQLKLGGAATGNTTVILAGLDGFTTLQPGVVLVTAGAGSSADAFVLAEAQRSAGLIAHGLVFDPGTGTFNLVTAPSTTSFKLTKIGEAAQTLWLESADAVTARLAADRDGKAPRGFWMSGTGSVATRDQQGSFTAFGLTQTANLGYRQDVFGAQFGFDFGSGDTGFGVTGGYAGSVQSFDASADRVTFDAWNIGAYAGLRRGGFFANALAKYDRYSLRARIGSAGERADSHGSGYGGRIEAGMRFGSDGFYAEPVAALSYMRIELDPLALSGTLAFADRDGGRASAGLRLGGARTVGAARVSFYGQGDYVRPLGGEGEIRLTTGVTGVDLRDRRFLDHGTGRIGTAITSGRVTGFIEGQGRFGEGYSSGSARAGIRVAF